MEGNFWRKIFGYPHRAADTCRAAALGGHLDVLIWLRDEGCPWDIGTTDGAVEGGHVRVLKWAIDNGCPWDNGGCCTAAHEG